MVKLNRMQGRNQGGGAKGPEASPLAKSKDKYRIVLIIFCVSVI